MQPQTRLQSWSVRGITAFAALSAFGTYFCMYAFRKPFTAAEYEMATAIGLHLDFKIAIIIAQVLGYATSKFIGIKVISELHSGIRFRLLLGIILLSWLALLGFALAEGSAWSLLWLFLNGLPLGMVWGIVFSYLEGRRTTEVLGAILCSSFILSSGAVKSIGAALMQNWQVSPYWMPFVVGGLFLPGLVVCGWLMEQIPPPSEEDIASRTARKPMSKIERQQFISSYAPGLLALVLCYISVTVYRDFRDNFAAELWDALGYGDTPAVFTVAELPIAIITLSILALTMLIKDSRRAFLLYLKLLLFGASLIAVSTFAFQQQLLPGAWWMVLVGAGLYIIYIPFNAILFDRLIAALGSVANVGFLMYLADAWGYGGSVLTLLYKNFGQAELSWLAFFTQMSYVTALFCGATALAAFFYFFRHFYQHSIKPI